jgi:voltage-gated potassium channel
MAVYRAGGGAAKGASAAAMPSLKKKIYRILDVSDDQTGISGGFDFFLAGIILLNVLALMLETVEPLYAEFREVFTWFEIFSIGFFTLEYLLRVWTITEHPDYRHPVRGRLRYMVSFIALVDLLAFLPFYLPMVGLDLRFVRLFRFFRMFRLFKATRYFGSIVIVSRVLRRKSRELTICFIFLVFMLIVSSCLIYFAERGAQPDVFSSIPAALWWGVNTITTVGTDEVTPITPLGRVLGGLIAVLGVGFFALPSGILASGFSQEVGREEQAEESEEREGKCPTCGR